MYTRLRQVEARIEVHSQRIPILIDMKAPEVIIGHELCTLNRLCGEYTREYLSLLVADHLLTRYCKRYKQQQKD